MPSRLDTPHGRGDFFKSLGMLVGGFLAEQLEAAVTAAGPRLLRPPGALDEFDFLVACTRCDKCVRACPMGSIVKVGPQGVLAAGTPAIDPRIMPCYLCSALPCVTACPEGALVWPKRKAAGQELEGPPAVEMGTARVRRNLCLTYERGDRPAQACRTCVDRCPYPGAAIRLGEPGPGGIAHPQVVDAFCTGCGLCSFGCPTPEPAIVVEPRGSQAI
jgi:MauM/NapG family ferredoxin protein